MKIQPSEISAILKREIENFGAEAQVSEVGQVLSVGDGIARVYGLGQCAGWRTRRVPGRHQGHGAQSRDRQCWRRDFRSDAGIKEGDTVKRTGAIVDVPVGKGFLAASSMLSAIRSTAKATSRTSPSAGAWTSRLLASSPAAP